MLTVLLKFSPFKFLYHTVEHLHFGSKPEGKYNKSRSIGINVVDFTSVCIVVSYDDSMLK